jgi:hypothetical protein
LEGFEITKFKKQKNKNQSTRTDLFLTLNQVDNNVQLRKMQEHFEMLWNLFLFQ